LLGEVVPELFAFALAKFVLFGEVLLFVLLVGFESFGRPLRSRAIG
jgi:hypothetical protein